MDISNAPSAVGSPASSGTSSSSPSSSGTSSSSPSSVSPHVGPQDDGRPTSNCICIHGEDAYQEEGRCSTSLPLESELAQRHVCRIQENGVMGIDQQVTEGSSLHHDQGLTQVALTVDYHDSNSGQPAVDSSGSDADVEKGWGSSNTKHMDGEEEGPGECCRVCHLTVDKSPSAGDIIKLGCACKDDLALAHRHCAERWFKIKGNRTCEICGSTARNIHGRRDGNCVDQWNDVEASHAGPIRAERCWQNQPLCNTLVVCVLLVLIASWLFRVTLL